MRGKLSVNSSLAPAGDAVVGVPHYTPPLLRVFPSFFLVQKDLCLGVRLHSYSCGIVGHCWGNKGTEGF